jgi:biotin carboxyl carrier protein
MRWKLKSGDEIIQVELHEISENSYTFSVNGEKVTLSEPTNFPFSIESADLKLGLETWNSQKWRAAHGSKVFNLEPMSESSTSGSDAKEVKTQMPGRILKILVSEGQTVEPQQTLIIMEAMKMENEIRASTNQKVSRILVKAGESVEAGALLVAFE